MIQDRSLFTGPTVKRVLVLEVDLELKLARVQEPGMPTVMIIPLMVRRIRDAGGMPRVGETWLIDRTLGSWTFAAIVTNYLPGPDLEGDVFTPMFLLMGC